MPIKVSMILAAISVIFVALGSAYLIYWDSENMLFKTIMVQLILALLLMNSFSLICSYKKFASANMELSFVKQNSFTVKSEDDLILGEIHQKYRISYRNCLLFKIFMILGIITVLQYNERDASNKLTVPDESHYEILTYFCIVMTSAFGLVALGDMVAYYFIQKYTKELNARAISNFDGSFTSLNSDIMITSVESNIKSIHSSGSKQKKFHSKKRYNSNN